MVPDHGRQLYLYFHVLYGYLKFGLQLKIRGIKATNESGDCTTVRTIFLSKEELSRKFGCNKQPEVSNILPSITNFNNL